MYLYKLSFTSKKTFTTFINNCKIENNLPKEFISVVEVGKVPIPATFDEEGKELTESGLHSNYAVDILTSVKISKLDKYLIPAKENYYHTFAFGKDPNVEWVTSIT
jgi:hypothetical protein